MVKTLMGKERLDRMKIFAGDIVERKKPNPDIYDLAKVLMTGVGAAPVSVVVQDYFVVHGYRSYK